MNPETSNDMVKTSKICVVVAKCERALNIMFTQIFSD